MAKVRITGIQKKDMPSKFGNGTWKVCKVKLEGKGETIYELSGFGNKQIENLKAGDSLNGYFSKRHWGENGVSETFNKISAEYVYELLLKLSPNIESVSAALPNATVTAADEWNTVPVAASKPVDEEWSTDDDVKEPEW